MAITRTPHSARIRLIDANENSVQNIGSLRHNLTGEQAQSVRTSVNLIRIPAHPATGGFYTMMDKLEDRA